MIDDQRIIDALLTTGNRTAAAKLIKCSPKTIQRRFDDGQFRQEYQFAVQRRLTEGAGLLAARVEEAVNTICELMTDKETSAGVRLQAAQTLLKAATTLSTTIDTKNGASLTELLLMEANL